VQKTILLFVVVGLMFAFSSCEKKDKSAGLEIQPDENRLKVVHVNLDQFVTYTSRSEAVKTSKNNTSILLGSIYDDNFGRTSAFMMSQYRLSSDNVSFGNNPQIVSINAFLDISGIDGDSTETLQFKIFETTFDIDPDSAYASNIDLSTYVGDLVGAESFKADSFNVMQISLLNSFGQKILDADQETLKNNDNFLSEFKGLYFTVDTSSTTSGVIWRYNLNSALSYILLKYTNTDADGNPTDTSIFKLQFNENSGRFNQYIQNTSPLDPVMGQENTRAYVSGLGGTKAHVSLSPMLSWRDSTKLMIYKAELLIHAEESSVFSVPNSLLMEVDDTDDEVKFVDDYLPGSANNFGGKYDSETKTYSMVITRHIQNLINNNQNDSLLWIYPYAQITNPYRVILSNGENDLNYTLKITYSKLY